ncbi:MAG TPA: transcription antitermination factor NusB [Terracidiphilus sp.]|jgi:16S rRNA (cytosine967-C5)-methyltransferase
MSSVSPSRHAAFSILMAVERGQAHSDDLLRGKSISALAAADRHLATALVLGVLRWQTHLDSQLRTMLKRPEAKLDPEVLTALRLGAFQLLHLDRIPARAAIDESVELTKQSGHRFASGMVNAVLRKLAAVPRTSEPPCSSSLAAHPHWMVDRWTEFFGDDLACAICTHNQSQSALTVRLISPALETELIASGIALEPGKLLTAARIVTSGDVTATAAFQEGRIRIQDEGSQLVAEIAGQGSTILDCCAAPGGKTFILAERNPAAHIVACESSPQRLQMLRSRLATLGPGVDCRLADATTLTFDSEFDLVLADVPCSGTGTLSRNPEIRHRLRLEDLPRQAARQRAILASALRAVRPGGRVVYSTCSLETEENEQVVAATLAAVPGARALPLSLRIAELLAEGTLASAAAPSLHTSLTPEGYLRLLPGAFRTDGFFIALIEKKPV